MATQRSEADELRSKAQHLSSEVLRLQRQLGEVHGGDANALRRAYAALVQHVQALKEESQAVGDHIRAFDVEVASPDEVANELTNIGLAVAALVVVGRVAKGSPLGGLRVYLWAAGGAFVTWRITTTTFRRLGSLMFRNRNRKRQLLRDWDALQERVQIMEALTHWEGGHDPAAAGTTGGGSPASSEGGSGSASWVDVTASPSRPAPLGASAEGNVSYPSVYKSVAEGKVSYPKVGVDKGRKAVDEGDDLPSAPPLPGGGGGSRDTFEDELEQLRRKAGRPPVDNSALPEEVFNRKPV